MESAQLLEKDLVERVREKAEFSASHPDPSLKLPRGHFTRPETGSTVRLLDLRARNTQAGNLFKPAALGPPVSPEPPRNS